jgi:hypothetical protein
MIAISAVFLVIALVNTSEAFAPNKAPRFGGSALFMVSENFWGLE